MMLCRGPTCGVNRLSIIKNRLSIIKNRFRFQESIVDYQQSIIGYRIYIFFVRDWCQLNCCHPRSISTPLPASSCYRPSVGIPGQLRANDKDSGDRRRLFHSRHRYYYSCTGGTWLYRCNVRCISFPRDVHLSRSPMTSERSSRREVIRRYPRREEANRGAETTVLCQIPCPVD